MAIGFDRLEFIRALKDTPGVTPEAAEQMADALAVQLAKADTVERRDLAQTASDLRRDLAQAVSDLKIWTAGVGGVVFAGLSAIKLFG